MNKIKKSTDNFKVLLVYPNIQMCEMMPVCIGVLSGVLRREGYQVDLFDTTFYVDKVNEQYDSYHEYVQEFDWKVTLLFKGLKTTVNVSFPSNSPVFEPLRLVGAGYSQ